MPAPGRLWSATVPPSRSTCSLTIGRPSPCPETSVMTKLVLNPERKMSSTGSCAMSIRARRAAARTCSGSIPRPSSETAISIRPFSRGRIAAVIRPRAGLPAASRSSGVSSPWSTALRTRWISGSLIASSTRRSTGSSPPSACHSTSLPSLRARSRTIRGKISSTVAAGVMRTRRVSVSSPSTVASIMCWSRCRRLSIRRVRASSVRSAAPGSSVRRTRRTRSSNTSVSVTQPSAASLIASRSSPRRSSSSRSAVASRTVPARAGVDAGTA